ncbi:MAG: biotin/lipoyl-binding protein [Candidatus Eisenbacteria bacterium]|nr:biotin/lipoyl-binding protein [Candidatus Eisenbacteria bacterium]
MKYSVRIGEKERWVEFIPAGSGWKVLLDGVESYIDCAELSAGAYSILTEGRSREVAVDREGDLFRVRFGGATHEMTVLDEVRARTRRPERKKAVTGPVALKAPMPGLIVAVKVAAGDEVQEGQALVVMEAMKMQNELGAPAPGKVDKIHVQVGQSVDGGASLITLAPPVPAEAAP